MKEEDKNKKTDLSDFLRYTGNEMTGRERNAFEKELQKDPFAEEAAEGFSGISPDEALKDITKLNKTLKSGINRRQRVIYYRIAASVAVLMVISSIFIFTNRKNNTLVNDEIALNTTTTLEIPESKAISEPEKPASETVAADRSEKVYKDKTSETIDLTGYAAGQKNAEISIAAGKADVDEVSRIAADNMYVAQEKEMALAQAAAPARSKSSTISIKGRVISSEDNQPVPGATVVVRGTDNGVLTDSDGNFNINLADNKDQTLMASYIGMEPKEFKAEADTDLQVMLEPSLLALNEVVVVGYGVSENKKAAYDDTGYTEPEPAGGQQEFDRYIRKNIRKPVSQPEGEKMVVVVSFTVKTSGTIENIKVIRSPGEEHSAEAIRLIKEGPSWQPATRYGEKVDDDVRIRITFK